MVTSDSVGLFRKGSRRVSEFCNGICGRVHLYSVEQKEEKECQ